MNNNSIMMLSPYKHKNQWVFDDKDTGLVKEPFVQGIDLMIDELTKDLKDADKGFTLLFSATFIPNAIKLDWVETITSKLGKNGELKIQSNWYFCESLQIKGWLCPALYNYFEVAPKEIYIQIK